MAWLRGRVSLGSFPDLAGAVNKISESVKNIEKNFDNALGLEDQQGGSTSTIDASHSWSPEFMAFTEQKDGHGTAGTSKKLESSKTQESSGKQEHLQKHESLEKQDSSEGQEHIRRHESLEKQDSSEKQEHLEKQDSSDKHESSSHPSFSKNKEGAGADADDLVNTTNKCSSSVRDASAGPSKPEEDHVLSKENKAGDGDDSTNSTEEHFRSVREASVETLKHAEHQDHIVETNGTISEEADNIYANTDVCNQVDGIVGLSEEAEKTTEKPVETNIATSHQANSIADSHIETESDSQAKSSVDGAEVPKSLNPAQYRENSEIGSKKDTGSVEDESVDSIDKVANTSPKLNEVHVAPELQKSDHELSIQDKVTTQEEGSVAEWVDASYDGQPVIKSKQHEPKFSTCEVSERVEEGRPCLLPNPDDPSEMIPEDHIESSKVEKEQHACVGSNSTENVESMVELEMLKKEMKKMEMTLLGAARQAQAKADEIAKLMNENEQLKSIIEDQRRKLNEAEIESLREEYHQRVSTLERKVYALTRERDTLRREQNKKNDATALLKEKDEIITQVMAEGEELSKKQAVQESTIRRLRAQIREFEEEKKALINKLQIEEKKVENIKRDKTAIEKLLQETKEKNQSELATQKEYYMNALSTAKEAKALAEACANDEARTELENQLLEAEERETMLVQTLNELRQTLSRTEQQAVFREDMLRRDIDDIQKRYQASERRCEELVLQVPESTRPLLRQIEAMQETTARKAEAWAAVERSLSIRLQDAEAKAASAEDRDRSVNERLSQTLSRINVLEAQISCLRAEQTQLTRSLEKERQRASESRQEYLALKEEADTHKGHVNQLKEEMTELKRKHKRELQEALTHRELLQQDMEHEKAARLELEKTVRLQASTVPGQGSIAKTKSMSENGLTRRLSSASSISSMEESFFLQASLDSSHTFSERKSREPTVSPYYLKSMTPNAFQAALRQKEGELASYISRLSSMESIRDSLSEELVKMTEECEKLRSEVALLPSIRAELEALRVRHSAALELMGERDEELEELRADIVDMKEMYREQVNMLVNKIQKGLSIGVA